MTALYLAPIGEQVPPGVSGYQYGALPSRGLRRRWCWRGEVRCVERRDGSRIKSVERFGSLADDLDGLRGVLDLAESRGITHPGSYGSLSQWGWHMPRARAWARKQFRGRVPGGWVRAVGTQPRISRPMMQYDIRSAYLAAIMDGLPDPASMVMVRGYVRGQSGIWWVQSPAMVHYPYPWDRAGVYPATHDEIDYYLLGSCVVGPGMVFEGGSWGDIGRLVDSVQQWGMGWKGVARAVWGGWGSGAGLTVETLDGDDNVRTQRDMPVLPSVPAWAVIVTSRVRLRLAQLYDKLAGTQQLHLIQTDSITVDEDVDISCGDKIGDWRMVARFPQGGYITPAGILPPDYTHRRA